MSSIAIRPATEADYQTYVRLVPELGTNDPIASLERYTSRLLPGTFVAEDDGGQALGYSFFQVLRDTVHVRHVVTAPAARRRGVARLLLQSVALRGRNSGCTKWCLNVDPDNVGALALYESLGFERAHRTQVQRFPWLQLQHHNPPLDQHAWQIEEADEAAVEEAMKLEHGQLARARLDGGRIALKLEDAEHRIVGMALFDPGFPGAYPFRVARPELALDLLHALRSHAREGDAWVQVVFEGQPEAAAWLHTHGSELVVDLLHMRGSLAPR